MRDITFAGFNWQPEVVETSSVLLLRGWLLHGLVFCCAQLACFGPENRGHIQPSLQFCLCSVGHGFRIPLCTSQAWNLEFRAQNLDSAQF